MSGDDAKQQEDNYMARVRENKQNSGRPVQPNNARPAPGTQPQWSGYGMVRGAQGSGMATPKKE